VIKGLEQCKYIYNNKEHSIEHFIYLLSYVLSVFLLFLFVYSKDQIFLNYFIFMFTFAGILLLRHIQKERLNDKFTKNEKKIYNKNSRI